MTNNYKLLILFFTACTLLFSVTSCKKFADVEPASNIFRASDVFSGDATVKSGIAGMYSSAYFTYGDAFQTDIAICPAITADELQLVGANTNYEPFFKNTINANSSNLTGYWNGMYKVNYMANAMLEGVEVNKGNISPALDSLAKGESYFMRAFCHFNLVNWFGDVPLVLNTDAKTNNRLTKTSAAAVMLQIIEDLKTAKPLLRSDYLSSIGNNRLRANKFAASALLARAYLYTGQWALAEAEATSVINMTTLYKLLPRADIGKVFYPNSLESIWQMNNNSTTGLSAYRGSTAIGGFFLSYETPPMEFTPGFDAAFEPGDLRRLNWTREITYVVGGVTYKNRFPVKYKNVFPTTGATAEAYCYLRLAEQYLIRAEARAQQGQTGTAAQDLNAVRDRAGLGVTLAATKESLLLAIEQERRVELFTEGGHRLFDLRRTGRADLVLGAAKPTWNPLKALFPIPNVEILNNPNLVQNNGYR